MSLSKCECGAVMLTPTHGYPSFSPSSTPPEEGHVHEYKPYDPLMEMLKQISERLERIEKQLG